MTKTYPTPGPVQILPVESDKNYIRVRGTVLGYRYKIANVHFVRDKHMNGKQQQREIAEAQANAELIAEAFNVLSHTGLTPLELAKNLDIEKSTCAHVQEKFQYASNNCARLLAALKRLSFYAQTTGGTAGPDISLVNAIAVAEQAISSIEKEIKPQDETVRKVPEIVRPLEHINPPDNEILALAHNLNNLLTADAQNNTDRHIINKMIKYLAIHFAYEARHD